MSNDLAAVSEIAIMQAVTALRQNAVTPRLVWRDIDSVAAQQNQRIDVPIFNEMAVQSVTAGSANTPTDVKPRSIPVTLDQWQEVRFVLSDRELAEIMTGSFPKIMERAVKAIANKVDVFVLSKLSRSAGAGAVDVGTGATVANLVALGRVLDENAVPPSDRSLILSPLTKSELVQIDTFHEADKVGDQGSALREGSLGRAFGFNIHMNQNVSIIDNAAGTTHNGTYVPGTSDDKYECVGIHTAGTRSLTVDTGTGTMVAGDVVEVATAPGTYVVTTTLAAGVVVISPGLRATVADNAVVKRATAATGNGAWKDGTTYRGIAFHQDAFAFASRPLQAANVPGAIISMSTDPITGLSLRLTGQYINKQMVWSLDILYGGETIEHERIGILYT